MSALPRHETRQSILDAALAYERAGYSVIPTTRNKKGLPKWTEYQTRRATPDEIRRWWRRWPYANIGIIAGQVSGIFAVDADDKEALEKLIELGLTPTYTVKSRRGYHFYYRWPGFKVSNSRPFDGYNIDIKGDRGIITAPPSQHASGFIYTVARDLPIADAPGWLIDAIRPPEPKPAPMPVPIEARATDKQIAAYVNAGIDDELSKLRSTAAHRNDALRDASFVLGRFIGGNHLDRASAERELETAAEHNGYIAKDGRQAALATIKSGLDAGIAQPRDLSHLERRQTTQRQVATPATIDDPDKLIGIPDSWRREFKAICGRAAKSILLALETLLRDFEDKPCTVAELVERTGLSRQALSKTANVTALCKLWTVYILSKNTGDLYRSKFTNALIARLAQEFLLPRIYVRLCDQYGSKPEAQVWIIERLRNLPPCDNPAELAEAINEGMASILTDDEKDLQAWVFDETISELEAVRARMADLTITPTIIAPPRCENPSEVFGAAIARIAQRNAGRVPLPDIEKETGFSRSTYKRWLNSQGMINADTERRQPITCAANLPRSGWTDNREKVIKVEVSDQHGRFVQAIDPTDRATIDEQIAAGHRVEAVCIGAGVPRKPTPEEAERRQQTKWRGAASKGVTHADDRAVPDVQPFVDRAHQLWIDSLPALRDRLIAPATEIPQIAEYAPLNAVNLTTIVSNAEMLPESSNIPKISDFAQPAQVRPIGLTSETDVMTNSGTIVPKLPANEMMPIGIIPTGATVDPVEKRNNISFSPPIKSNNLLEIDYVNFTESSVTPDGWPVPPPPLTAEQIAVYRAIEDNTRWAAYREALAKAHEVVYE